MATDYDAPRKTDDEIAAESLETMQATAAAAKSNTVIDIDENEMAEGLELPGADLSGEVLAVHVIPIQTDEFTCSSCFLVHHHSQLAAGSADAPICSDCAA
jgi:hypothetical protein